MKHVYSEFTSIGKFTSITFVGRNILFMENEEKIFLRSKSGNHPSDSISPHFTSTPFLADRQRSKETHSIYLGYARKLRGMKVQQGCELIK